MNADKKFIPPAKPKKPRLVTFGGQLPPELALEFRRQAKRLRISQNVLLAAMITHCLKDLKEQEESEPKIERQPTQIELTGGHHD